MLLIGSFLIESAKKTLTRKLPYLPRIGIVIDFAGKKVTYKNVPLLETMVNMMEQGVSLNSMKRIVQEQFSELNLSKDPQPKIIDAKVVKKVHKTK